MSYLTSNAIVASGVQTITIPGGASVTSTSVAAAGVDKTTDSILITLNINAESGVAVAAMPYLLTATTGTGFTVAMELANGGGEAATCFLSWAVLR